MNSKYLTTIVLVVILILAFFLRIIHLDKIPSGISDDELNFVLTARSFLLTGHGLDGKWTPLSFHYPEFTHSESTVAFLLPAVTVGFGKLSLFTSRLSFVFYNLLFVLVLYLFAKELFNKRIALLVAFVAAINPWNIFFSRTAFEVPVAILFLLFTAYLFQVLKPQKVILAVPFILLAFFTYNGIKVILLPFVIVLSIYTIKRKKLENAKQYHLIILFTLILTASFFIVQKIDSNDSRISEIYTPNSRYIKEKVDITRRESISHSLVRIFENKYTVYGRELIRKYYKAFSPQFLFLHGDGVPIFFLGDHGYFYYLDALFIILGILYFYDHKRKELLFLLGLLLIAPIPAVVSKLGDVYSLRASLVVPVLILFTAGGVWYFLSFFSGRKNYLALAFVLFLYFLQVINFYDVYFFRFPIFNSTAFGFSGRILAKYLSLAEEKGTEVIVGQDNGGPGFYKHYLFYNSSLLNNSENMEEVQRSFVNGSYSINNVSFVDCSRLRVPEDATLILESAANCTQNAPARPYVSIVRLKDSGEVFRIYDDRICKGKQLNSYVQNVQFAYLNVEDLSSERFCDKFIVQYKE